MKKHSFLAGMLTMALIVGLGMSALAATGSFTITVDPVNIQVNGTTFAPKDAKGNDVPVFALNGTTYAPLRALAEAYGLTVGYDGDANMATVASAGMPSQPPTPTTPPADYSDWSKEDEAAYQEFKGLWEVKYIVGYETKVDAAGRVIGGPWERWELSGKLDRPEIIDVLGTADQHGFTDRLAFELRSSNKIAVVELAFLSKNGEVFPRSVEY